ncbi:RbsD/FucU family protein [Vibrio breoganii]|uniref:RbsD/FucU family protein n=1 Tax=Vibrio breoganii TaxID=553239 RepID=UPI000C839394|nr:RbsD/FucU family protein [Vibrio breoganii]PMI18559.1 RbsD/FucU transporter [Vibrio breoganii]PMK30823.1 RbsD/FucU transporter [Vibrio breoganii]PMK40141.1 RbsD/FucU transporter [Vibrio breoganii]
MLKTKIIHPELLGLLANCGHKTKVLIADANYSFVTNSGLNAKIIYLNFKPGMLPSTDVLEGICDMVNVESAEMMAWPDDFENTIQAEYQDALKGVPFEYLERSDFYNAVKADETLIVIATGEQRRFANILLTIGAVF